MKTAIFVLAILGVAAASVVKRQVQLLPLPHQVVEPPQPVLLTAQQHHQAQLHWQAQQEARIRQLQPIPHTYNLPSGAELIIGNIRSTFSCIDKIYGYYADVDNNCQIFHVCVPFVDENNNQAPITYNFFCGNQTVFDQANLVCASPDDATPCSVAQSLYSVNENFGKTDRPLLRE